MNTTYKFKSMVLIILTVICFSCAEQQQLTEIKTINVLDAEKRELNISEIADDITYLPLDNDSLLSSIKKVVFVNGQYFVLDNKFKFLRFDENGKILNQVGKKGAGPGEYRSILDFVVNPDSYEILIQGPRNDQLLAYSPDGKYIRSLDLTKRYLYKFETNEKNILAYFFNPAENDTVNIQLMDANGTILKNYKNKFYFKRGKFYIPGECLIYQFGNHLRLKEACSDTLFYMDGEQMIPEMILNSGDKQFTPEVRTKINREMDLNPEKLAETINKILIPTDLFETNNYLFYRYRYDDFSNSRALVYNKSSDKLVEFNDTEGIINDWDGGPNIHLKMNKDDNTVLSWIDAYELKQYVESDAFKNSTPKYPEKKKQLEQLANSLDENDNPVLMLVKLKK